MPCDMMWKKEKKLGYTDMPGYQAVQLPYSDKSTFATVILPKDSNELIQRTALNNGVLWYLPNKYRLKENIIYQSRDGPGVGCSECTIRSV
eukprot:g3077.t1